MVVFSACTQPAKRINYIATRNVIAPPVRHYGQREVANLKARDPAERGTETQ